MRAIAGVTCLVFAAAVVVAQDAVEPSAPPVYPLCELAFATASEALPPVPDATEGPAPTETPAAAESPGEATHSPGPSAASPPSANPSPPADLALLDDAVRRCSSVEEFAAAAARYPEVLGEVEPTAFLAERCRDPDSGLDLYASCASVAQALATPAPTPPPSPTAAPMATSPPEPREDTKPGTSQRRTTGGVGKAYRRSVNRTYGRDVPTSVRALRRYDCTGLTQAACEAQSREAQTWVTRARRSLRRHLDLLQQNPPPACLRDAYTRDRTAARTLLKEFSRWRIDGPGSRQSRNQRMAIIWSGIQRTFSNRLDKFFEDCR